MYIENKIKLYEKDICSILSNLAFHVHPAVVELIQEKNSAEYGYFKSIFDERIDLDNYLFDGSSCVFPGVKRYVSGKGKKRAFNESYQAIIDDNTFPRHLWCYLINNKGYSGPNWKETGLSEFELAHIFTHKDSEIELERKFFSTFSDDLTPYGDFSCACNVVLLPKGTVRPTDNSEAIKSAFYMRYIELYGEAPLNGRSGFKENLVPDWYSSLKWNEPKLPSDWKARTSQLLSYRTRRITQIMSK